MKRTCVLATVFSILISILGVFHVWAAPSATTQKTIKIGALISLTGPFLHEGPQVRRGIELALEHFGNTVEGKKIELIIEDDDVTDPTMAMDKARKLVEKDGVSIIIGQISSNVANAVQPYLTEKKVISLKSQPFPLLLIKKFPYMFANAGTLKQNTAALGDYAYNVLKYKTVSTMAADYVAGRDLMAGFTERFKELGGAVVQEQFFPLVALDFAPYLINLTHADALAAWTAGQGGGGSFAKQYVEYGLNKKMPLITPNLSGFFNEDVLPSIGDIVLGVAGSAPYASTVDNALNKKVVADYKKKYNEKPGDSVITGGYINAQVVIEALKATKGDTDPDKIKAAILNLKIETPAGPLRFNGDRLGVHNTYICKIAKVGGEYLWQVVQTYKDVQPR